jgi:hypothetical protein
VRAMRKVKALPPKEWAPLSEAFARAKAVHSFDDLAAHGLIQGLRDGRLIGGGRQLLAGGEEDCFIFSREFWRNVIVDPPRPGSIQPRLLEAAPQATGRIVFTRVAALLQGTWFILIQRAELDRLYARAAADQIEPSRRKPGPKPTEDWPEVLAAWLVSVAHADRDQLRNFDALVIAAGDFLDEEIKWSPSDPEELRKRIRGLLRFCRGLG